MQCDVDKDGIKTYRYTDRVKRAAEGMEARRVQKRDRSGESEEGEPVTKRRGKLRRIKRTKEEGSDEEGGPSKRSRGEERSRQTGKRAREEEKGEDEGGEVRKRRNTRELESEGVLDRDRG